MSKSADPLDEDEWTAEQAPERPLLALEKQLFETLELKCFIQWIQIAPPGATSTKARAFFEGLSRELQIFIDSIRERVESRRNMRPQMIRMNASSYWLFAERFIDPYQQFEALLCGYACYARQTSETVTCLRRSGEWESCEVLRAILKTVHRCLRFLEICLESLALNPDGSGLPDWLADE